MEKAQLYAIGGIKEIELRDYPQVAAIYSREDVEHAEPVSSEDIACEPNEGGQFRLASVITPCEYFKNDKR